MEDAVKRFLYAGWIDDPKEQQEYWEDHVKQLGGIVEKVPIAGPSRIAGIVNYTMIPENKDIKWKEYTLVSSFNIFKKTEALNSLLHFDGEMFSLFCFTQICQRFFDKKKTNYEIKILPSLDKEVQGLCMKVDNKYALAFANRISKNYISTPTGIEILPDETEEIKEKRFYEWKDGKATIDNGTWRGKKYYTHIVDKKFFFREVKKTGGLLMI